MEAVAASGYPLQTLVAQDLRRDFFHVQEEWSFIDRDSDNLRTMDVFGLKYFSEFSSSLRARHPEQGQLDSGLALFIECKRSELPYVFFLSSSSTRALEFPLITGLPPLMVRAEDGSNWPDVPIGQALGLDRWDFVAKAAYCTAFAKGYRKGKRLGLSGDEPFNNLVLPLGKALDYYERTRKPPSETMRNYIGHLTVGLGVLDAPMVGIRVLGENNEAVLLPWVRVVRHETTKERHARDKRFAIDIVHKDFLRTYLEKHLFPAAERFSALVEKHRDPLFSGQGRSVSDEPRLVPRD